MGDDLLNIRAVVSMRRIALALVLTAAACSGSDDPGPDGTGAGAGGAAGTGGAAGGGTGAGAAGTGGASAAGCIAMDYVFPPQSYGNDVVRGAEATADTLYWHTLDAVYRVPVSGGAPAAIPLPAGAGKPTGIFLHGADLLVGDSLRRLYRIPGGSGAGTMVGTLPESLTESARLYGDALYFWTQRRTPSRYELLRVDVNTAAFSTIHSEEAQVLDLAKAGERYFFSKGMAGVITSPKFLQAVSPGAAAMPAAPQVERTTVLAADDQFVYFQGQPVGNRLAGSVYRMPVAGGPAEPAFGRYVLSATAAFAVTLPARTVFAVIDNPPALWTVPRSGSPAASLGCIPSRHTHHALAANDRAAFLAVYSQDSKLSGIVRVPLN